MRNKRNPYLPPLLQVIVVSNSRVLASSLNFGDAPDASKEPDGPPELDAPRRNWDFDHPDDYWNGN